VFISASRHSRIGTSRKERAIDRRERESREREREREKRRRRRGMRGDEG
jgi:hypothetical protein